MNASTANPGLERMPLPSRGEFYKLLGQSERPVIFHQTLQSWPAWSKWNFEWFKSTHGDVVVPIEWLRYSSSQAGKVERVGQVKQMPMKEFLTELLSERAADGGYLIGRDIFQIIPSLLSDLRFPPYR
jgi:hypothetical protein